MGKMTLLLCSLAVSGLASYYGLGAFFESSSQLAYDLKSNLLAKHTYMVFFGVVFSFTYILLSWVPNPIAVQGSQLFRRKIESGDREVND